MVLMNNLVEELVFSYDTKIERLETLFNTTHQLVEKFQDSFLESRQEREKINSELRSNLAKNNSLRKKDFDNMMGNIISIRNERENEVRNLLKCYLDEQNKMARNLRENFVKLKKALVEGDVQRIKEFKNFMSEIVKEIEMKKAEVTYKLKDFQKEQQLVAKKLKGLLIKGRELRIKDLKFMLGEFNAQHRKRIACKEKRRDNVHSMLDNFKKERKDADPEVVSEWTPSEDSQRIIQEEQKATVHSQRDAFAEVNTYSEK
jgi:hypothetical protein